MEIKLFAGPGLTFEVREGARERERGKTSTSVGPQTVLGGKGPKMVVFVRFAFFWHPHLARFKGSSFQQLSPHKIYQLCSRVCFFFLFL